MLDTSQPNNTSNSRNFQGINTRIDFASWLTQCATMDGESFERAIVDTLAGIIKAKNLRHDPSACQAWPYKKAPGRAWQAMRTNGKAQKMTLRDAFSMAQFLGVPMSQLCAMVESQELRGVSFRASKTNNDSIGTPHQKEASASETRKTEANATNVDAMGNMADYPT